MNAFVHITKLMKEQSTFKTPFNKLFPRLLLIISTVLLGLFSCKDATMNQRKKNPENTVTAKEFLGNPIYQAISYGGYRMNTRDIQPTISELKEDLVILSALGIKVLRTYNAKLAHASNVLEAIDQMKKDDPSFEMYVMLGAWINCKDAFTENPDHSQEDSLENKAEIERVIELSTQYPDIVKIISVGNEAMVKWAASYFVEPKVILKWVKHLQEAKETDQISKDIWITSSDNFASWGGGDSIYHTKDLTQLIHAVDYVSMHTYPMHDTHYNPVFWGVFGNEKELSKVEQIDKSMDRAITYVQQQYASTSSYIESLGIQKEIHIGETGWSSFSNGHYSNTGSKATDEYKEGLYYKHIRNWTNKESISCFYFEAFDEIWKDAGNPEGSENHFGLFTVDGQAKFALWDEFDRGAFENLSRNGTPIEKTYAGNKDSLLLDAMIPPYKEGSIGQSKAKQ